MIDDFPLEVSGVVRAVTWQSQVFIASTPRPNLNVASFVPSNHLAPPKSTAAGIKSRNSLTQHLVVAWGIPRPSSVAQMGSGGRSVNVGYVFFVWVVDSGQGLIGSYQLIWSLLLAIGVINIRTTSSRFVWLCDRLKRRYREVGSSGIGRWNGAYVAVSFVLDSKGLKELT